MMMMMMMMMMCNGATHETNAPHVRNNIKPTIYSVKVTRK